MKTVKDIYTGTSSKESETDVFNDFPMKNDNSREDQEQSHNHKFQDSASKAEAMFI